MRCYSKKTRKIHEDKTIQCGQKSWPAFNKITVTGISSDYGKTGMEITIAGANFAATIATNVVTLGWKSV